MILRPRSDDLEDWLEVYGGTSAVGHISRGHPYDGLTDEEADELKAELVEKERKRIRPGFYVGMEAKVDRDADGEGPAGRGAQGARATRPRSTRPRR